MKKNVKVSVMLEYELCYFSRFLNDFVSKKVYSDGVISDSVIIDTDNCDLTMCNEYHFLNSFCYELYKNDSAKFSSLFLYPDRVYGKLKFSAACEFISIFRNNMSCNFHVFADGKKVDSDVISSTVYARSTCKEKNSHLRITAHVHFDSSEL